MLRFCCDRRSGSALPARDEVQRPASPYRRYPDGAHRAAPASVCATGRYREHECGLDRRDVEGAQRAPAGAQDPSFALVDQPGRVGAAVGRSSRFHRRHGAQFATPGRAKPVCHQRSNGAPGDGRAPLGGGGWDYREPQNYCRPGAVCGHFTQIIWAATEEVGCGVAGGMRRQFWVCFYLPPGNFAGQKPY